MTELLSQSCLPDGINLRSQIQIDSFPMNYPNCTKIEGNVDIYGDDINNLDSLISITSFDSRLTIRYNSILSSLNGLSNVTKIGMLDISGDNEFEDLTGLENVDSINSLIIFSSDLTSLNGLNNLTHIGYQIVLYNNKVLNDISALSNIGNYLDYLEIRENDSLHSLTGLENLNSVGVLAIIYSPAITDLTGLDNIDSIMRQFDVNVTSITDCYPLSNLTYVGDHVGFSSNLELTNFSGLENLNSIGGSLIINDNFKLSSLTGLDNLDSINGDLIISGNDSLTDISALENLNTDSIIDLEILGNHLLSECEIESVCNYLIDPNGEVDIYSNMQGCNSQEEVENACLLGTLQTSENNPQFLIYPNPTKSQITISNKNEITINEVIIYNQFGQKVFQQNIITNKIDISMLCQGIYILEIVTDNNMIREKLIIN